MLNGTASWKSVMPNNIDLRKSGVPFIPSLKSRMVRAKAHGRKILKGTIKTPDINKLNCIYSLDIC